MEKLSRISLFWTFCLMGLSVFFSGCVPLEEAMYGIIKLNQENAVSLTLNIISNQVTAYDRDKRFDTSEELKLENRQVRGYKIEMTTDRKSFQIWGVPLKYGQTGKMSYYADSTDGNIHGANHQGGKANNNDPIVFPIPDELKEVLREANKNQEK